MKWISSKIKFPISIKIGIQINYFSSKSVLLYYDKDLIWLDKNESSILISEEQANHLNEITKNLIDSKPIDFLVGYKYFYNSKIFLEKGVFVPQFDTEVLVERAISWIKQYHIKPKILIFEPFLGSGAISISIAKNISNVEIIGIDSNEIAIELSKKNIIANNLQSSNIFFYQKNFFDFKINKKLDMIIANPPYIDINDPNVSSWVINNQPKEALFSDNNGLHHITRLIRFSLENLDENGILLFEAGFQQKEYINLILKKTNNIEYIFHNDLSGNFRFIEIRKK